MGRCQCGCNMANCSLLGKFPNVQGRAPRYRKDIRTRPATSRRPASGLRGTPSGSRPGRRSHYPAGGQVGAPVRRPRPIGQHAITRRCGARRRAPTRIAPALPPTAAQRTCSRPPPSWPYTRRHLKMDGCAVAVSGRRWRPACLSAPVTSCNQAIWRAVPWSRPRVGVSGRGYVRRARIPWRRPLHSAGFTGPIVWPAEPGRHWLPMKGRAPVSPAWRREAKIRSVGLWRRVSVVSRHREFLLRCHRHARRPAPESANRPALVARRAVDGGLPCVSR